MYLDDSVNTHGDEEEVHNSQGAFSERGSSLSREFANDPTMSPASYDNLAFSDFEDEFVVGPLVMDGDAGGTPVAHEAGGVADPDGELKDVSAVQEPLGRIEDIDIDSDDFRAPAGRREPASRNVAGDH